MERLLRKTFFLCFLCLGLSAAFADSVILPPGTGVIIEDTSKGGLGAPLENTTASVKFTAMLSLDGKSLTITFKNTSIGTTPTWLQSFNYNLGAVTPVSGTFSGTPAGSDWIWSPLGFAGCCSVDDFKGGIGAGSEATLTLNFTAPQQSLSFAMSRAYLYYIGRDAIGQPKFGIAEVTFFNGGTVTAIPEPATLVLLSSGLTATGVGARRRRKK